MTENIDTRGAVDLGEVGRLAAIREAAAAEQAEIEQRVQVVQWDRKMTRAFKGIFPRSQRMAWLKREHERLQRKEQG